jgi:DNA-directed RNA polymerase subunit F
MEIKNQRFVTSYEAKKILKKRSKDGELNYEQKNAFDYLNKFCKIPEKEIQSLLEGLSKIEKLNEKHIVSIVEMMPQDIDDLRLLFANERIVLDDDEKNKIINTVKKVKKGK